MKEYSKKLSVLIVLIITILSLTGCSTSEDEFEVAVGGDSVINTALESDSSSDNLVTDAYTDVVSWDSYEEQICCYHIPQVNLSGNLGDSFNEDIYDKFYSLLTTGVYESMDEYDFPNLAQLVYTWGQKDNLVSIVLQTKQTMYDWTQFYVYTIDTDTGEKVTYDDLYESYGLSEDDFYDLAKTTMQKYWDEQKTNLALIGSDMDEEEIQSLIDQTLADNNVKESIPYINASGELCAVTNVYWFAGAGEYLHLFNLSSETDEGYIECTVDHSITVDSSEETESTKVAETTQATTQTTTQNITQDTTSDYDLYQAVIDEYKETCDKDHSDMNESYKYCFCSWTIYDIDGDRTEELIIQDGISEQGRIHYIYTVKNGKAVKLGEYSAWHMSLYDDNGKLVAVVADAVEYWYIYDITIDSGSVSVVETDKVEYTEDYPSYSNYVEFEDIDYSLAD